MHPMPGLRGFSLAWRRSGNNVSCGEDGVFVGNVSLLNRSSTFGKEIWTVRPINELNDDLTNLYRLPVDATGKLGAMSLVAVALNRGDPATAAIATVQMQFPDPPRLEKGTEARQEIARRADELFRSGLLKFWDPTKHPRAGTPPNPGRFAPTDGGSQSAEVAPVAMRNGPPWRKPFILEGGEGGGGGSPRTIRASMAEDTLALAVITARILKSCTKAVGTGRCGTDSSLHGGTTGAARAGGRLRAPRERQPDAGPGTRRTSWKCSNARTECRDSCWA